MLYDCFISYSSSDLAVAEALHKRLIDAGFNVWFDKARLQPGCDWHKEIEDGCEHCRVVLPLLTPRWKESEWTRYETYGAEAVIPLLLEGAWSEVSTPPLTQYQNLSISFSSATDADWQSLFASIRDICSREVPRKEERVHRLRYHPAKHFVGREEDLIEIHDRLFVNPTAALTQGHVQAIAAMGGVGKTTLARQYCEKFWRCYAQMFWVDCRLGLETEFAAIHDMLRPEPLYAALPNADKVRWVRSEFNQSDSRPRRLLILDNAEDEESLLEWIPKTGNCHTLITSRFTGWSSGIDTYRVWVLKPEPARELLMQRSGRANDKGEREAADEVAKRLEYLPLALEQAAAYVAAQPPGWGFVEYLTLYEANERAFLAERTPGATEYPSSVYLTWRATIDKLPHGARAILRLHAFFASTPTPVSMFTQSVELIVEEVRHIAEETGVAPDADIEGAGEFAVRRWISSLAGYSLAQLQPNDSFSVHSLVHTVERHALGEHSVRVLTAALRCVDAAFVGDAQDVRSWPTLEPLAPHAQACAQFADGEGIADPTARLYDDLGELFYAQARYKETEPLMRRALAIDEATYGPGDPKVATDLNGLAVLLKATNRLSEAEPLIRRALSIYEASFGSNHLNVATVLNNLARLLGATNRLTEAEPLYRRAMSIDETHYGPDHPEVAISVNNLALLLQATNRVSEAEPLYRRAVSIFEQSLGRDHRHVATGLTNLGGLLRDADRGLEAEPLLRRALLISEHALGTDHPQVAAGLYNLALLLQTTGRLTQAESLYRRALSIDEVILGPDHPNVATRLNILASLLRDTNRFVEAEPMSRRALSIDEGSYGPNHPDVARDLNNLALLLQATNRLSEAEPLFRRAVEILLKFTLETGHRHPNLGKFVANYRNALIAMGRTQEEAAAILHEMAPELFGDEQAGSAGQLGEVGS